MAAPGGSLEERARRPLSLEEQARPPAMAGAVPPGRQESPLWLKAMRLPSKLDDASAAFWRRVTDARKRGAGVADAFKEGIDAAQKYGLNLTDPSQPKGFNLNRDIPPTAVRAGLGIEAGKSSKPAYYAGTAADYFVHYVTSPSTYLGGPVAKLGVKLLTKAPGGTKVIAGVQKGQAAVAKKAGQAAEKYVAHPVARAAQFTAGVGPVKGMMREVKERYETPLALRFQQAGQIPREMRDWIRARRATDPGFNAVVEGYRKGSFPGIDGRPGVDPVTDLVRFYVKVTRNKGTGRFHVPQIDPADMAKLTAEAAKRRVPLDVVQAYGNRLLGHAEETLAHLRATGAHPAGDAARGRAWRVDLPPKGQAEKWLRGRPLTAADTGRWYNREAWFNRYMNQLTARPAQQGIGEVGASAFAGAGIKEVRYAGVRQLVQEMRDEGRWVKELPAGTPGPKGWVPLPHDVRDLGFLGRQTKAGEATHDLWVPPTLSAYLSGELRQFIKMQTRAGKRVLQMDPRGGIGTPGERVAGGFWNGWSRAAGRLKQAYLSSPATVAANTFGNFVLSELAMARHGVPVAHLLKTTPAALKEVLAYRKTGKLSPLIEEFSRHSRAFVETEAQTAALRSGAKKATEGALAGRVVAGRYVPPAKETVGKALTVATDVQGATEQASKLALYLALKPKLGAEKAAKAVDKYLFDYSDRPLLLQAADQYGVWIFNTFPTKALGLYVDTLVKRPDLAMRYPRLSRLMREEQLTPQETEEKLPPYRMGPATVPVSRTEPTFADLSRYNPFESAFQAAAGVGLPLTEAERTAPPEGLTDRLSRLPGQNIIAPLWAQLENRQLYSSAAQPVPIVPKGAPPGQEIGYRARELARSVLPAAYRAGERIVSASQGQGMRPGKWVEDPELRAAMLAGLIGIPIVRAERFDERKERLEPVVERRAEAMQPYRDALDAASGEGDAGSLTTPEGLAFYRQLVEEGRFRENPYAARYASVTDPSWLKQKMEQAKSFLQGIGAEVTDASGKLTNPEKLIDAYLHWKALVDRLEALDQEEIGTGLATP